MGLCDQDLETLLVANLDASFYLLVEAYQYRLFGYVLHLLRHYQDAEDVVQNAFINAYKALSRYTWLQIEELDLEAWLFTIARNLALNYRSREGRRYAQLTSLDLPEGHELLDEGVYNCCFSLEAIVERKEVHEELYACIERLPEMYREPMILHYIIGFSYQKIAEMLDQPLNTVKSNGYRGFKKLQELVKEHERR